jgi:hypothetical protein
LSFDHPDAREGKLYAEVERLGNPNQMVLCSITPNPGNKFNAEVERLGNPNQMVLCSITPNPGNKFTITTGMA